MKRPIDTLLLLLTGYVGLHLPRSFLLLYVIVGLLFWRTCLVHLEESEPLRWVQSPGVLRSALFLLVFSVTYGFGMLAWGFWLLPADALDALNALLLPGLLFLAGVRAASLPRTWSTRLLLTYAFGALLYVLIALAFARSPWWNWSQVFPVSITVPWGSSVAINVRSVEQNGYPALLLLAPGLMLTFGSSTVPRRLLGAAFLSLSALGAHVVGALEGRLGWLTLVVSMLPVVVLLAVRLIASVPRSWCRSWPIPALVAMFGLAGVGTGIAVLNSRLQGSGIWSQGLCEERFSLYASILARLGQAPWGGRRLQFPFRTCGDQALNLVFGAAGQVGIAHNVWLDIYYTLGFVPVLLLLAALAPSALAVVKGFVSAWPAWDWQVCLRWCCFCLLLGQWLFQPLQYSDGLLYYLSFFVAGLFLVEGRRAFLEPESRRRTLHS